MGGEVEQVGQSGMHLQGKTMKGKGMNELTEKKSLIMAKNSNRWMPPRAAIFNEAVSYLKEADRPK
ncbi:uncharacterized protein G2W53_020803 [Senna tora]|uniref:Uncharacterized protein n=1 Tax=Senna tora TaxID=362788 RepID=A0A834TRS3_9FABA|nr:uncharacterized protein G2W53_020803 [Senna tora]